MPTLHLHHQLAHELSLSLRVRILRRTNPRVQSLLEPLEELLFLGLKLLPMHLLEPLFLLLQHALHPRMLLVPVAELPLDRV